MKKRYTSLKYKSKKLKLGDEVIVISGSFKRKSGKILSIKGCKVKVSGVALIQKRVKGDTSPSGSMLCESSIFVSKIKKKIS